MQKKRRTWREGLRYQYIRFAPEARTGDDMYVTRCLRLGGVACSAIGGQNEIIAGARMSAAEWLVR